MVMAFAIVLPLLETPKAILAIAIILSWCLRLLFLERQTVPIGSLDWAGLARVAAVFASAFYGVYLFGDWGGLDNINHDLLLVAFFVLMPRAGYGDRAARLILAALLVGSIAALASLLIWPDHPSALSMAILSLRNANITAFYLALTSAVALGFLVQSIRSRHWLVAVVFAVILVAQYAGIAFTGSRAGAVMALVGALVVPILGFGWRRALPVIALLFVIAAITALSFESRIVARLSEGFGENFLTYRDLMWACGWNAFLGSPLLGYGAENLGLASQELLASGHGCSLITGNSHNYLLNVMVETGLIGTTALLWLFYEVAKRLWAARLVEGRSFVVWASGVVGLCQVAVGGLVDEVLASEPNLVLGLMVGLAISYAGPRRDA